MRVFAMTYICLTYTHQCWFHRVASSLYVLSMCVVVPPDWSCVFAVPLLHLCRTFAALLPYLCRLFAVKLPCVCRVRAFAVSLPCLCRVVALPLPWHCREVAARSPRPCRTYAIASPRSSHLFAGAISSSCPSHFAATRLVLMCRVVSMPLPLMSLACSHVCGGSLPRCRPLLAIF